MADYLIKDTTLEAIADAIREKRGTSEDIFTEDFADEIMQISGGGGEEILDWQMPILNSDVSIEDGIVYSVIADSVLSATVNQCYKAFDGDSTTYWHSAGSVVNQHYLKLFASSPVKITHIDYQNVVDASPVFVQSFSLYGSNNDSDYTLIGTYTVHPNTSTLDSIDVDNDNFYTSYRFDCVPVGTLGGQYYSVIADMGLSGQIKKNASSPSSDNHINAIIASPTREGNNYLKTRVKAGKYICILEQGQLSGASPTGLTSSGTEIFSFQSAITNSRYCFIKEFELEEDGWIECSGGFQESIYLTTRRYIFKVDFDLDENILEDIKIENAWDTIKTLSTQDSKVFICVMNTEETGVTDVTSTQDITEKINYGCACFVYDENNGNDYTLSSANTNTSWTTNVYWAFSIV